MIVFYLHLPWDYFFFTLFLYTFVYMSFGFFGLILYGYYFFLIGYLHKKKSYFQEIFVAFLLWKNLKTKSLRVDFFAIWTSHQLWMDAAGALSDPDLFQDFIWNSIVYSFYSYISIFVFFISVNILLGLSLWTSCKMYLIGPVFNCSRTSVGSVQSQYRNRYINLQFFFIFTSLNKQ